MKQLSLEDLKRAAAGPRAGTVAQERMIPNPRRRDTAALPPGQSQKEAAVLVLVFESSGEFRFVLTLRTETVATHKGQVSLPGGTRHPGEPLEQTALRETGEELGIDPSGIELLGGPLTPLYIPVSGFWVTPYVGLWRDEPVFRAAPAEVIEVIEPRLSDLVDDNLVQVEDWEIRGVKTKVPFFYLSGHKVWGATAMMLGEFAEMLKVQAALQESS
ncbi:MAG: NUDIX hydrolase [Rudaea sp.]